MILGWFRGDSGTVPKRFDKNGFPRKADERRISKDDTESWKLKRFEAPGFNVIPSLPTMVRTRA